MKYYTIQKIICQQNHEGVVKTMEVWPIRVSFMVFSLSLNSSYENIWLEKWSDSDGNANAGFKEIFINTNISDLVWDEEDKVVYRSTPMFLVGGEK